MIKGAKMR